MKSRVTDLRWENMTVHDFGPWVMKETKVCMQCGARAEASQQFCKKCGRRLPLETLYEQYKQRHVYCKICDRVVRNDAEYCPHCGKHL